MKKFGEIILIVITVLGLPAILQLWSTSFYNSNEKQIWISSIILALILSITQVNIKFSPFLNRLFRRFRFYIFKTKNIAMILKRAQFYLATCYDHGYGTDKNIELAFKWFLKAAKQGHMESQYNIGFFYAKGEYVKQDYKKAVYWYSLSASQGDTEAQRDLGYSYFYGQGVKKDEKKAVEWYKKAATKNDDKAFYNLGLCYKEGDGVKQSNRWARHFFTKAYLYGHRKANGQLKKLP